MKIVKKKIDVPNAGGLFYSCFFNHHFHGNFSFLDLLESLSKVLTFLSEGCRVKSEATLKPLIYKKHHHELDRRQLNPKVSMASTQLSNLAHSRRLYQ